MLAVKYLSRAQTQKLTFASRRFAASVNLRAMSTSTHTEPAQKKQKKEDYVLYYVRPPFCIKARLTNDLAQWPGLPGRGEYIRLAFEYAGIPYGEMNDPSILLPTLTDASKSGYPPHFAPPALKLPSGRFLSQTAAILNHIAPKFGLAGKKEGEDLEELRSVVNQLVLTALDLSDEVSLRSSIRTPVF